MKKNSKPGRVGVRELKNYLSAYLQEVKKGATLMVTEHDVVIAELKPATDATLQNNPILASWVQNGLAIPPVRARISMPVSFLSLPAGTAQTLLDEDRGE